MINRNYVIGISVALICLALRLSKPSPDDLAVHILNKCATYKEKVSIVTLASTGTGFHNTKNPIANLITFISDGRVKYHEGPVSTWVTLDGKTVAYGAIGLYKVPDCSQLRRTR